MQQGREGRLVAVFNEAGQQLPIRRIRLSAQHHPANLLDEVARLPAPHVVPRAADSKRPYLLLLPRTSFRPLIFISGGRILGTQSQGTEASWRSSCERDRTDQGGKERS